MSSHTRQDELLPQICSSNYNESLWRDSCTFQSILQSVRLGCWSEGSKAALCDDWATHSLLLSFCVWMRGCPGPLRPPSRACQSSLTKGRLIYITANSSAWPLNHSHQHTHTHTHSVFNLLHFSQKSTAEPLVRKLRLVEVDLWVKKFFPWRFFFCKSVQNKALCLKRLCVNIP